MSLIPYNNIEKKNNINLNNKKENEISLNNNNKIKKNKN